ncbi:MAG: excinuclease ABC subunit UvrA [Planctomycetota bacterium]|nr:excinuclease ABC subunit UvrA [Planctomycetota bacterium]
MSLGPIRLTGVRQNNLRGFDVEIPRGSLTAITGVSGSGKSSLAFDTLFREGQRRFLETLSAYARQFVGRMEKPDVEHIEGLAPAIAVDQRSVPRGARSTVGTLTEVFDHLRVLYARAGTAHCPEHDLPLTGRTPESVVDELMAAYDGRKVLIAAPVIRDRKGQHKALFLDLVKKGFVRARVDGTVHRLEEVPELERYVRHTIEVVVDRLKVTEETRSRVREAVATGLEFGGGDLLAFGEKVPERSWSTSRSCRECGREAPPLEPRLFSFNSPHGACETCDGLGMLRRPTPSKVIADPSLAINEGALAVTRARGGALLFPKADFEFLERVARENDFDLETPWCELSAAGRDAVLYGTGEARYTDYSNWAGSRGKGQLTWKRKFHGVIPSIERAIAKGTQRKQIARFLGEEVCPDCRGSRLGVHARTVRVGGIGIHELLETPISELEATVNGLALSKREQRIARDLLTEVRRRASFLMQVGLGYLTLHRSADTLSGGEAQRIRLAAQLGAGLQGVLYVLDEPSIGLHARDQALLFRALEGLRDLGNTVVVVEHDEATLRGADHLIDIGPGAGRNGGYLVASGTPSEVAKADSPTAKLLRGELPLAVAPEGRVGQDRSLILRGARGNNLQGIDVEFPLGLFVAVTGVSGSGKSTLVNGTLRPALMRHLELEGPDAADHDVIEGLEAIDTLVVIDASPIGRTPRSNPATYTGAFGPIRDLFASLPESKMRGWKPGRFSFNVAGGRCEACSGAGATYVELQFLAPGTVPGEECGGHRFGAETLGVRFKGKNIADVLDMSVEEALEFFADIPKVRQPLAALNDVGLSYVQLGQPSTTLSGGEAQRIKLAKHLQKRPRGTGAHSLFLLDEPTTGLHQADVQKLVTSLHQLVDLGHSVVVIEHNLDLVSVADHVIDLGPEGGSGGGGLVFAGTPADLTAFEGSHTGRALARGQAAPKGSKAAMEERPDDFLAELSRGASNCISVRGARTHNLKAVDVDIPRGSLTIVTGPSGSGKTSLALDTIHAAGERRFVDSLSTYARQFLGTRDRPPVDRIDGLGPSVVVEARGGGAHPRSTVATATELHDYLRVLFSRAGKRRCPHHGQVLESMDAGRVARAVAKDLEGQRGWIVAPIHDGAANGLTNEETADEDLVGFEDFAEARAAWIAAGFARVLIDGVEARLTTELEIGEDVRRVDLVVDRLDFGPDHQARIAEAVEQAESLADGRVSVLVKQKGKASERHEYSLRGNCTQCGFGFEENLEPRHFSFNAHVGACPDCSGLGASWQCDADLLITHPERPLLRAEGGATADTAIAGKIGRYLTKGKGYYEAMLREVAKRHKIDLAQPWRALTKKHQELILFGTGSRKSYSVVVEKEGQNFTMEQNYDAPWPGLCGHVDAWHKKSEDPGWSTLLEESMARKSCRGCKGERLAPGPRAVTVGRKRLPELLAHSVEESVEWFGKLRLDKRARQAVGAVLDEIGARLAMLDQVGLGYLSLDRNMGTLSGGELRRVRLSANLGSNLVDVCYVLDEPTVGLHPSDVEKLGTALMEMRDRGNTVIVVEHDEALMRRADYIVDIGPGAGRHGGEIVATGTPADIEKDPKSLTGRALRGEFRLEAAAAKAREAAQAVEAVDLESGGGTVGLRGAKLHNLRGVGIDLEFGRLTGVCGPSGSGKSTLVLDCLVPALRGEAPDGRWSKLVGSSDGARRVVVVDASPIGRSPASTPATAVGLLDEIRELYARTPDARMRGFTHSHFSYNSTRGRCPACEGRGATRVDMQFLADLWLTCEECDGKRYRPEILEVRHRGLSVADLLSLSVDEAREVMAHQPAAARILDTMAAVGLGYLALNQSSTTLSGGEAQRVKLAGELMRTEGVGRSVVVLDEPTTGLHAADVERLVEVLLRLAARGDAVVVIEHHTDLLAICDELIELGPAGGSGGGRVIATGTPAELAGNPDSITGPWLGLAKPKAKRKRRQTT